MDMTVTIILDGCGLLILLLLLIPHFSENPSGRFNRRKRDLLLYSALLHFFVLCVRLTGAVTALTLPGTAAATIFRIVAIVPAAASAVLLVLCILCDAEGKVRVPKGQGIPVGQIACAVLPPMLALCLRLIVPGLDLKLLVTRNSELVTAAIQNLATCCLVAVIHYVEKRPSRPLCLLRRTRWCS